MRTPKKIWKSIAKKFKNRKGSPIATTAKGAAIEELRTFNMPEDVEEVKVEVKEQTNVTETDTKLCNINSEDLQPINKSSEEAQIETTVELTSVDRADSPSSAEPCFDATDEKEGPLMQQRQAILAGVVGAVLLASGVASYLLIEYSKVHVIAVIGGIVGLACISFALYHTLKPNTKLEKIENVEQPIVESSLSLT